MASNKIAGIDVLLSASADGGTTSNVIGGQSGATLNRSTNVIEVSSKDGNGWTESIAGMKSWSVECEGFMVKDDAGLDALETAWENGNSITVEIVYNGNTYSGEAILSDFPNEFPQDDAVTFSISLTGTGALSKTAVI
jgi:TP901-1 family phage major tail protein